MLSRPVGSAFFLKGFYQSDVTVFIASVGLFDQGLDQSVDSPDFFLSDTFDHLGDFFSEDFFIRLLMVKIKELFKEHF